MLIFCRVFICLNGNGFFSSFIRSIAVIIPFFYPFWTSVSLWSLMIKSIMSPLLILVTNYSPKLRISYSVSVSDKLGGFRLMILHLLLEHSKFNRSCNVWICFFADIMDYMFYFISFKFCFYDGLLLRVFFSRVRRLSYINCHILIKAR